MLKQPEAEVQLIPCVGLVTVYVILAGAEYVLNTTFPTFIEEAAIATLPS